MQVRTRVGACVCVCTCRCVLRGAGPCPAHHPEGPQPWSPQKGQCLEGWAGFWRPFLSLMCSGRGAHRLRTAGLPSGPQPGSSRCQMPVPDAGQDSWPRLLIPWGWRYSSEQEAVVRDRLSHKRLTSGAPRG